MRQNVALAFVVLVLAACGSTQSTVFSEVQSGNCTVPLHTKADFDACDDPSAQPFGDEDVSLSGNSRHVWRFTIEAKDPDVITAALATAAHGMAVGVTEHTLFAYADEDTSRGFNRGRLILRLNRIAEFDICSTIDTLTVQGTTFDTCSKRQKFTVDLSD